MAQMTLTVQLRPAQQAALEGTAAEKGLSKSQIVDAVLTGYLRRALRMDYPQGDRFYPGVRGKRNIRGMHSFVFDEDQYQTIVEALGQTEMSFAQLLEAAAADQYPRLYNRPWPSGHRAAMPFGRPPDAREG